MKKGLLIGGIAVIAVIAAAGIMYWQAESDKSNMIRMILDGSANFIIPDEPSAELDLNDNGKVDKMDLIKAKLEAMFSGETALQYEFYSGDAAKQLGRTAFHADTGTLWCSLSGSGIEFSFLGTKCLMQLVGDSAAAGDDASAPRYAVYLNDELIEDAQLTEEIRTVTIQNSGSEDEPARVRLVKLSESMQSSLGIGAIGIGSGKAVHKKYGRDVLTPAEEKEHLIEFIGDSITCGYGVDGENGKDTFKTANEDVTKAYAYLTAQKLGADYSMVSYSGHGIISGYTNGSEPVTNQLVPKFYGQVGHGFAVIEGRHKIQDDLWDFARQPDAVVINLGTNDASYTGSDSAKQKEFAAGYTEFLKTVRGKNPDAVIVCTLGIMGQTLCDAIDLAVSDYTAQTGDTNITTMRFDMQDAGADGVAVDWHPSAVTHEKAAEKLSAFLKETLGW